jgi:DNA glycosylase AlkZ-like
MGPRSLRRAAWAGLQDSMPRAALLSIHARVDGTSPSTWEDPALLQLWGPRFHAYVVATEDLAVFSLGRLGGDERRRKVGEDLAARLRTLLDGRRMLYGDAGRALGIEPNRLRYAAATGSVLIRWDGARQPVIWTVPPPEIDPREAMLELAHRFLHVFGPSTPAAFARWAGMSRSQGPAAFDALGRSSIAVTTPVGDAWILASDEPGFRDPDLSGSDRASAAWARLLPSGDAYFLQWGAERALLVPDAGHRRELWTSRVWPGAVLLDGEIVGTWRRAHAQMTIASWRRLSPAERDAVERESASLPLPGIAEPIVVRWEA